MEKTYCIFGAGAAGLYTAWRLLNNVQAGGGSAKKLNPGDTLRLYDWGKYQFPGQKGSRESGARVCTWHFQKNPENSYLEVGGMRYSYWDGQPNSGGHRLVTTVIEQLGLEPTSIPFNEATNPLYSLRNKNFYLNQISSFTPAPYNTPYASAQPDNTFNVISNLAMNANTAPQTRAEWCHFYNHGEIVEDPGSASVFKKGDKLKDIGYWNIMSDQLGSEGFEYAADGNGYSSNTINWNTAVAIQSNSEFLPGTQYKTLNRGYSSMFDALFAAIEALADKNGIVFEYHPNTRLHSILYNTDKSSVEFTVAKRRTPDRRSGPVQECAAAWMAMPRHSIELVARATRYRRPKNRLDVLNHERVQLFLESAIMQPSYKVGMFFDSDWWLGTNPNFVPQYPAQLESYEVTQDVLNALQAEGWPAQEIQTLAASSAVMNTPFAAFSDLVEAVVNALMQYLTVLQTQQLKQAALRNTIGPSVTDMPIRQVVYFGNNALDPSQTVTVHDEDQVGGGERQVKVFGILASYDDEQFTTFWRDMELGPNRPKTQATTSDLQTLQGPRLVPEVMERMLRQQLAQLHFGPGSDYSAVPKPLESRYMDWSLPPFNAGYHAFAAHYNVCEVQNMIRKPSQLVDGGKVDAPIFIVGEAYSNDQAWVEGAYCTSESVLNDFFGIAPLIDPTNYPFICPGNC